MSRIDEERRQARDYERQAEAIRTLTHNDQPNIFDKLANACKRKIALLEEYETTMPAELKRLATGSKREAPTE